MYVLNQTGKCSGASLNRTDQVRCESIQDDKIDNCIGTIIPDCHGEKAASLEGEALDLSTLQPHIWPLVYKDKKKSDSKPQKFPWQCVWLILTDKERTKRESLLFLLKEASGSRSESHQYFSWLQPPPAADQEIAEGITGHYLQNLATKNGMWGYLI